MATNPPKGDNHRNGAVCRHRRRRVPFPPTSPVSRDPPGGSGAEPSMPRLSAYAVLLGLAASLQVRAERARSAVRRAPWVWLWSSARQVNGS